MSLIYRDKYAIWDGKPIEYTEKYYNKLKKYEGTQIEQDINDIRYKLVKKYKCGTILDIGCGTGQFMRTAKTCTTYGYDVMKKTVSNLKRTKKYIDPYEQLPDQIQAFTFWDSLEHIKDPAPIFRNTWRGQYLFCSMPIFKNTEAITQSKHYRPGEHMWYFTANGLIEWIHQFRFICVEENYKESEAGRKDIGTFVFRRR